ncbi:uncharacterized protein [Argopecten irradians]|uniref:uncharacterized protein n=1 Tax=Argopecten irradians TaxID=31199 RepID=UPI00371D0D00
MAKRPGIFVAVLVLTFLGFFFQVAGLVLPWWFVVNDLVYLGVWYLAFCWGGNIESGNCTAIVFNAADEINQPGSEVGSLWFYVIFQICTTAGVFLMLLCLVGLMFGVCCACCKNKCAYVFCCVGLFLSALLVCPALALFGIAYIYLGSYLVETLSATTFPYSALASGLGCFITFVAAITLAIALCTWNSYMKDDDDDDGYLGTPMTQTGYTGGYGNPGNKQGYDNYGYPNQGYEKRSQPNQYAQPTNMYRPVAAKRY